MPPVPDPNLQRQVVKPGEIAPFVPPPPDDLDLWSYIDEMKAAGVDPLMVGLLMVFTLGIGNYAQTKLKVQGLTPFVDGPSGARTLRTDWFNGTVTSSRPRSTPVVSFC